MEINNYLNNATTVSVVDSTLTSSVNVKALEQLDVYKENNGSFTLEFDPQNKRSSLSLNLQTSMDTITSSQLSLKDLNQQSNILQNLKETLSSATLPDAQVSLEDLQPSVEELLAKYNYLSSNINKNFEKYQEETTSHNYFDGLLGAKPLNPADLIEAVDKQMEIVKSEKKFFNDNIEKATNKSLEIINIEIDKSNKEAPFKNIDFGKNTANFTSANINNVVGSVVSSQANAIPAHSPKLLA